MTKHWSKQQEAIFDWFVNATGHLIARALAGTGKTTTIVEAVKRYCQAHPGKKVTVCAFARDIKTELEKRFAGFPVEVKTLHGMGFQIVKKYWPDVIVDKKGDRKMDLVQAVLGMSAPDAIKKLVAKLHSLGREIHPLATCGNDLISIAENFECVPDEEWEEAGFDVFYVADAAYRCMELAASVKPVKGIDYSDMIFLPVRNAWLAKTRDLVVVDEMQDMTVAQLKIALGICKGRVAGFGDNHQAIFGFRGADSESLDRLKQELNATELGLTTTYRCGKAIVARSRALVPNFEAGADNPEGSVTNLPESKLVEAAKPGCFILSRLNAPIVSTAIKLLRAGKRTRVAGRNIGEDLVNLINRIGGKAHSVPAFLERVCGWEDKQVRRAIKSGAADSAIETIRDKAEMIRSLADGSESVTAIKEKAEYLFTDADGLGAEGMITCSSVHKAKGLEADEVFILASTLRDTTQEELNITYVAMTRAKQSLVFVY